MKLTLHDHETSVSVDIEITEAELSMPFADMAKRYLEPAFRLLRAQRAESAELNTR